MSKKHDEKDASIPAPPEPPKAPEIPEAPKEKLKGIYVVAPGKSVCCGGMAGILGPGKEVTPAHLGGTSEQANKTIDALIKRGVLVRK